MKRKNLIYTIVAVSAFMLCACSKAESIPTSADTEPAEVSIEVSVEAPSVSADEIKESEVSVTTDSTEKAEVESPASVEETVETSTETTVEEPVQEVTEMTREYINLADVSWIDPEKPMVALSFDDGPVYPVNDDSPAIRIQNALSENGMHATFFYWGNSLNNTTMKELTRAYELGFELGNHTKSHPDLTTLTADKIEAQVSYIDEKLTEITGNTQFLVRPPYLSINDTVKETINVPLISCGLDTKDWNNATTDEIIATITKACENGSLNGKIVLMHETYTTTAEAVEYLVPYLKEQGYQIVTISEMFKARGKNMKVGNVYTQCTKY